MAALRVWQTYVSDDGTSYEVLIPAWMQTQTGGVGFGGYDGTKARKPMQIHMRYITCTSNTTARHRRLHCGNVAAALWTTLGTTVTLPDINGTSEGYTTTGRIGERTVRGPHA